MSAHRDARSPRRIGQWRALPALACLHVAAARPLPWRLVYFARILPMSSRPSLSPCTHRSFGTLIYEMLSGAPPFYSRNLHTMYRMILSAELSIGAHIGESAKHRLITNHPARACSSSAPMSDSPTRSTHALNSPTQRVAGKAARLLLEALLVRDPLRRMGARGGAAQVRESPLFPHRTLKLSPNVSHALPRPPTPSHALSRALTGAQVALLSRPRLSARPRLRLRAAL